MEYGIMVHGGAGASGVLDGCVAASSAGFDSLAAGSSALDAAAYAVSLMEDDGRFNAGSGSVLRLDGITREMDASVMDSTGRLGIVITLRDIKNPVLAAKAVSDTPHVALSGEGATNFAKAQGFAPLGPPPETVVARYGHMRRVMASPERDREYPSWRGHDLKALWNFTTPSCGDFLLCDTVGAVALDKTGVLAVASSTGGASPMLLGRVGDTAMAGCGFYAGPLAAIAVTGQGEEMIRRMAAKTAYDLVAGGESIQGACERVAAMFPVTVPVGVIGITRTGFGASGNRDLPRHSLSGGF